MTTPQPGGTATEILPFLDGSVLTVVTDLASGQRTATLDNIPMPEGGNLAALTADGRSFRGGGGQPVIFDGVPVDPAGIDARLAAWQDDHPPQQAPDDGTPPGDDGTRRRHMALVQSRAFRGARGGPS